MSRNEYIGPCELWTRATINDGYGVTYVGARQVLAHRLAYEQKFGPVPDGLELDHLCSNRACVNPDHLEPVTHLENVRRGGRTKAKGEIREEILRCHDESASSLGARLGLDRTTIWRVRREGPHVA